MSDIFNEFTIDVSDDSPPNYFEYKRLSDEIIIQNKIEESKITKDSDLDFSGLKLKKIPEIFKTFHWVKQLNISRCEISELINLPPNLERLDAFRNNLTSVDSKELPDTITYLDLAENQLTKIPLTKNVEHLDIAQNKITEIECLPASVRYLEISRNKLSGILIIPDGITSISAFANAIRSVAKLPDSIKKIDVSNNNIEVMPILNEGIEYADFSSNNIKLFISDALPKSITTLNLNGVTTENIPKKLLYHPKVMTDEDRKYNMFMGGRPHPQHIMDMFNSEPGMMHPMGHSFVMQPPTPVPRRPTEYQSSNPLYVVLKKTITI